MESFEYWIDDNGALRLMTQDEIETYKARLNNDGGAE